MSAVPQHVGYILDGNRRWAKQQGFAVTKGHETGKKVVREIVEATFAAGVKYVSLSAFSVENWKRSRHEVNFLMKQITDAINEYLYDFDKNRIKILLIGERDGLPDDVQTAIDRAEHQTANNDRAVLGICINYSGRHELVSAVKKIVDSGATSQMIDEKLLTQHIYAPEIPDCDLIVRTSGEQRLSNFMLWRAAYSELLFIDKPWPMMTKQDVKAILKEYENRSRRFGG